jgi:hypothetical protein
MRAVAGADGFIADGLEKITVNILAVIPSEVEESRDVTLGYFCGVSRLRFATLEMTEIL